jgi:hypothetical protein
MSDYTANYRVILSSELPAREAAFFAALGAEVAGPAAGPKGAPLYQLTCTEVSFSHPVYLELRVFKEPETWLLPVFVPHERVLAVFGRTDEAFPLALD